MEDVHCEANHPPTRSGQNPKNKLVYEKGKERSNGGCSSRYAIQQHGRERAGACALARPSGEALTDKPKTQSRVHAAMDDQWRADGKGSAGKKRRTRKRPHALPLGEVQSPQTHTHTRIYRERACRSTPCCRLCHLADTFPLHSISKCEHHTHKTTSPLHTTPRCPSIGRALRAAWEHVLRSLAWTPSALTQVQVFRFFFVQVPPPLSTCHKEAGAVTGSARPVTTYTRC